MQNKILVILASVREGRMADRVANWIMKEVGNKETCTYELVDLKDWQLPYFDYPTSAVEIDGNYRTEKEREWSKKVKEADGFLIVTPEYNHSYPAQLKSAIDLLYNEWNHKAMSFVSYGGGAGGARAVEHLKNIASELQVVTPRSGVYIKFVWEAFNENGDIVDSNYTSALKTTIEQLEHWTQVCKDARKK